MKYIGQYIKKLCPEAIVSHSKTTESVYYDLGNDFIIRVSEHTGYHHKEKMSIVKSFNTEDFIVMLGNFPFPLVKTRKEVKELIKIYYELSVISKLTKNFREKKRKETLDNMTDWGCFWSFACQNLPVAIYLNKQQKTIIKEYFDKGVVGENMCKLINKIKPSTTLDVIENMFEKAIK